MRKWLCMFWCFIISGMIVVSCTASEPVIQDTVGFVEETLKALDTQATAQSVTEIPAEEPTSTPTQTSIPPTMTPTATQTSTPEPTPIPFQGFLDYFRLYRAWWLDGKTYFYFLSAGIDFTMYATADEYDLVCEQDPDNITGMICVAESKIEEDMMDFVFYLDEKHELAVFEASYNAELIDNTVYHHQFDCPDRGKNVTCNSEYRLYDGRCYYAHTCYDACGLYYSKDNIPTDYKEFQGFTTPCN